MDARLEKVRDMMMAGELKARGYHPQAGNHTVTQIDDEHFLVEEGGRSMVVEVGAAILAYAMAKEVWEGTISKPVIDI